jgi:hypothetical protein
VRVFIVARIVGVHVHDHHLPPWIQY